MACRVASETADHTASTRKEKRGEDMARRAASETAGTTAAMRLHGGEGEAGAWRAQGVF
jgi:hypothetical protein